MSEKKTSRGLIALLLLIIIILAGVAVYYATLPPPAPPPPPEEKPPPPPVEKLKVAFLLPGSITDSGWNAAMYIGAQKAREELDIDVAISEGVGQVGVDPTLRSYAERGYKIIFGWTIGHQDSVLRVAPDYPDVLFVGAAWWQFAGKKNMISFGTPMIDGAYMSGILAAYMTKTGIIGTMDGEKYPDMIALQNAYEDGAKTVKPNIKVLKAFCGVWDDVSKGREVAMGLIDSGADVLLFRGDGVTLGGIQACAARGVYAIGDYLPQHELARDTIIASNVVKNIEIIRIVVEGYRAGNMAPGGTDTDKKIFLGLKSGVQDLEISPYFMDKIPKEALDKVNKVREDIIAGRFEVPYIGEERA
ncbi:MAG: BMP family protein [Candidatus Bathyarchaeia archaeon]